MTNTAVTLAEANKLVVQRVFAEVVNGGNLDAVEELYAPDVVDHHPMPGAPEGIDGIRYTVGNLRSAMPDLTVTIEAISAHHDKVVVHTTSRGTQRSLLGFRGRGRQLNAAAVVVWRLEDGRVAERWAFPELVSQLA